MVISKWTLLRFFLRFRPEKYLDFRVVILAWFFNAFLPIRIFANTYENHLFLWILNIYIISCIFFEFQIDFRIGIVIEESDCSKIYSNLLIPSILVCVSNQNQTRVYITEGNIQVVWRKKIRYPIRNLKSYDIVVV